MVRQQWHTSSKAQGDDVAPATQCLQIKFLGSDGKEYLFLAKPKDDLRKDARMMEMMGVLNRLLARHPASRRRNLAIRR
jgi:phosphatidylinositol kinase/protein kinase (PI-3  family)